jgi:hypothetical protein
LIPSHLNLQIEESVRRNSETEGGEACEHDPHYEPIVSLPLVELHTNEEEEEELVKIRARLYRYDTSDHEWKVSLEIAKKFFYDKELRITMKC